MDLVDIDQVLDNLELREAADEHSTTADNRFSVAQKSDICIKNFTTRNGPPHAHMSSLPPPSSNTNSNSTSSSSNKSFIGVSQVFNSLDDYRKNVETLESAVVRKYDEEYKLIENIEVPTGSLSQPENTVQDDVEPSKYAADKALSSSLCEQASHAKHEKEKYDDNGETEDEGDFSNDIDKFTETTAKGRLYGNNDKEELLTASASDSLTTSSSSTFSSGLSPGLVSTTEEHSTPLSAGEYEEDDEDGASSNFRANTASPRAEEISHSTQLSRSDGIVLARQEEDLQRSDVVGQTTAGLDDLAVGLSSISINSQSDLPREMTVEISSALGGILNELSETNTTSLRSQIKDSEPHNYNQTGLDRERKTPSIATSFSVQDSESMMKQKDEAQCEVKNDCHEANGIKQASYNEPLLAKTQQPITFGSTMDEISDTELDSMLQDMDIDEAFEANKMPPMVNETGETLEYEMNGSQRIVNADSFSQASTVEFSEIRAQQQSHTEFGHSLNSISSSYSSSESLEDELHSSDGLKINAHEHTSRRPKRPTTLDLPVMKMNLYANAGQTPPGAGLTEIDMEPDSVEEPKKIQDSNEVPTEHLQPVNADSDSIVEDTVLQDARSITQLKHDDVSNGEGDVDADILASEISEATGYSDPHANLGKIPPIWVPDNMATACMQCHVKFTMIKRRHHCRACGKVLCSVCCSQKFKLEFLANPESRVCVQCFLILTQRQKADTSTNCLAARDGEVGAIDDESMLTASALSASVATPVHSPNPNNPMEYCSTIPPHRQVSNTGAADPPTVIVPVGVLKKDGSNSSNSSNSSSKKARKRKSVMFSDGIAPGSDLACMENQWSEAKHARRQQQNEKPRGSKSQVTQSQTEATTDANAMGLVAQLFRGSVQPATAANLAVAQTTSTSEKMKAEAKMLTSKSNTKSATAPLRAKRLPPAGSDENGCFIPKGENCLPPIIVTKGDNSCEFDYKDVSNNIELVERLQRETLKFALHRNFFVYVKIVNLKCCMNRTVINFTTSGLHQVGNDEIIILLEYDTSDMADNSIPKDVFVHLNEIYVEAEKCNPIDELHFTMPQQSTFLGSREYGGFLYIRASFQCLQDVVMPDSPFLIGVLIHRHEVPWAKVFPLRLMLRLGAQYRYYPCPHISVRNRESVYAEIAQTIINFLADFRNYSYTLPTIKGMYIHMEDRQTSVLIPRNRYEDIIKAINNSSDHILAFGGNFSKAADGHLVCIQNTKDESAEMYSYSTQAINIQGQPRKVTGASFFVLNEALKSTSGLSGKCSIVEDGLMVQILPTKMEEVRTALRNKDDIEIVCGPLGAEGQQTEIVSIKWVDNDRDFGIGVVSPIDSMSLEGVSGMRVHASFNYSNANYLIRLTEIYMIKVDDWKNRIQSQDITRISEQFARSTSVALLPFLDLLMASGSFKIGLRVTLHQENVCYEAGTRSSKLPPLYMNALDNHLIPTLHKESNGIEDAIVLELIFYILNA